MAFKSDFLPKSNQLNFQHCVYSTYIDVANVLNMLYSTCISICYCTFELQLIKYIAMDPFPQKSNLSILGFAKLFSFSKAE